MPLASPRPALPLAAILAVLLSAVAAAGPAATARAADPVTCAGYPETRQFVEAQSWWKRTPGRSGSDFGHVHLGGCIPEREVHRSTIGLDVRIVMHDNPGKVAEAVLVSKTDSSETTRIKDGSLRGFTCPAGTCSRWVHWDVPLSWFDKAGLQEIRYRVYVDEPDGNRMIASLNFQTFIENGRSRDDVSRMPYLRGKGWYTGSGYCEASLREPVPDAPVRYDDPFRVAVEDHGSSDRDPTHAQVLRDPDFHAGIPGYSYAEQNGPLGVRDIFLGAFAETGRHKGVIRADCADPRGSTNSGFLVFPYGVR